MELRHLRYFVAVAEEQSFTRAAERLWIAQPGLSQQIRALERELDVKLFDRLSRGVELTESGELFLVKARGTLAAADEALSTGRDAAAGVIGHLRVGLTVHARSDLVAALLDAFRSERPQVELTVVEAHCGTLLRDVRDGRLDAAIVLAPVQVPHLESAALYHGGVIVTLERHHAKAARERITTADLDGQVIAVSGDRGAASYDRAVGGLLESLGVRFRLLPSGYGPAMLSPVRSGAAIALTTGGRQTGGDVVERPLEPRAEFGFDLAWRTGESSATLEAFLDTTRRAAARAGSHGARRLAERATLKAA